MAASDPIYAGPLDTHSGVSEFNSLSFVVRQILGKVWTATIVQVAAVNTGAQTVDLTPLVNQIDGQGNATPHGTIFGAPYLRLQGGSNAVIIDPAVGDLGIALFANRDISAVKASKAAAPPGSRRQFDPADALYMGGLLNGTPTQTVSFGPGGIAITSPTLVAITAPVVNVIGVLEVNGVTMAVP